jgi:beta-lactamase superfamily II metal-dependent hydrolase
MFEVTMLPAREGDAIWIEYGDREAPHRILVDGGMASTWDAALEQRFRGLETDERVELLMVSHVDRDHIGGVLKILDDDDAPKKIGEVWVNLWEQLVPEDILGPVDGEIMSAQLEALGIRPNESFGHAAVRADPGERFPEVTMPGGMRLTVMAPGPGELAELRREWKKVVEAAGLAPGVPSQTLVDKAGRKGIELDILGGPPVRQWAGHDPNDLDDSEANGSSITVLAEYDDPDAGGRTKRLLLTGDGFGPVLAPAIERLALERGQERLKVDAVKLPHHGSRRNVTSAFVKSLDSKAWLFSSDGTTHEHPDKEAVARVLVDGKSARHLKFNYRTDENMIWDDSSVKGDFDYTTEYGDGTLTVAI